MDKIKIVFGKRGSGKTRYAEEITKNSKSKWINFHEIESRNTFRFNVVDKDTEVVIIDNILKDKFCFDEILFFSKGINVEKQCQEPFFAYPEFILIFDDLKLKDTLSFGASIRRRIELIEIKKTA